MQLDGPGNCQFQAKLETQLPLVIPMPAPKEVIPAMTGLIFNEKLQLQIKNQLLQVTMSLMKKEYI